MIYALASLFTFSEGPELGDAWGKIQRVFNVAGVTLTALPHFSWHVAMGYDFPSLERHLATFVRSQEPFRLHVAGVGIFSGEQPVIYLPVTKTPGVAAIHNELSGWIEDFTSSTNTNYLPEAWIPHITLSGEGFNADGICQVVSELAYIPLDADLTVDHLAIIYRDETTSGVRRKFNFGGGVP